MTTGTTSTKPRLGMTFAFPATPAEPLAGIPGRVISIWPRFRSGDYLVTLEFPAPVKTQEGLIAHIDAFLSELCPVAPEGPVPQAGTVRDASTDARTAHARHAA
jgi:hypothetical protein